MQSVMISIQPVWVEKILNGEKTVEVRKSKPKLQVPFKCYIYCTKSGGHYKHIYVNEKDARKKYGVADHWSKKQQIVEVNGSKNNPYDFLAYECYLAEGKVVGEFTCDYISEFTYKNGGFLINHDLTATYDTHAQSGLTAKEFREYAKEKSVYGWHISELVVYDEPKELSEFKKCLKLDKEGFKQCSYELCPFVNDDGTWKYECDKCTEFMEKAQIKRPPQSWCYVEDEEGKNAVTVERF